MADLCNLSHLILCLKMMWQQELILYCLSLSKKLFEKITCLHFVDKETTNARQLIFFSEMDNTPVNWICHYRRLCYNCHLVNCKFLCHGPQVFNRINIYSMHEPCCCRQMQLKSETHCCLLLVCRLSPWLLSAIHT